MSADAAFCRHIRTYAALIDSLRARSDEMKLARIELDRLSGLSLGHSGKILSKNPRKGLGRESLGLMLETLGLILIVVEDPVTRDRTLARRIPFQAGQRRVENTNYAQNEPPRLVHQQPSKQNTGTVSRAHLRVVQAKRNRRTKYG